MAWKDAGGSALGSSRGIAAGRSAASVGGFSASGGRSAQGIYNRYVSEIGGAARQAYRRTQGSMERGDITLREGNRANRITKMRKDIAMKKVQARRVPVSGPKTAMQDRVHNAFGGSHLPIGFEYRK